MRYFFLNLCVLLSIGNLSLFADDLHDTEIAAIEEKARTDAKRDSDEKFWALATFAGSTFFGAYIGIPALGAAVLYQPPPPAHRFFGKSPRYIQIYTHIYKDIYRRTAIRGTLIGCLGGGTLYYLAGVRGLSFVRTW